jgi:arylsulfatase A-like enzyme
MTTPQKNAILIVFDQLLNYSLLPQKILDLMPGYNAFKKIGIEYKNAGTNRTACSPSRSVIQSGFIDTGIQDSVNSEYQKKIQRLNEKFDTGAKLFKRNGYNTAYVGKQHIDNTLNVVNKTQPRFCTNTRGGMKIYGYDTFNTFGDAIGYQKGMMLDAQFLELNMPPNSLEYDYYNKITNTKQNGVLPYLRARKEDGKQFYLEFHITNPHDIHECKMNVSTSSIGESHQYYFPFMKEQLEEAGIKDSPYFYNEDFTDAYIKNINLQTNYFEDNYEDYKTNLKSLPFLDSFIYDFAINPINNMIYPNYVGFYEFFRIWTSLAEQNDIKSWKNLVNTYYGLIIEADSYLYKVYLELEKLEFLENTCVIITADHGEFASAHGQRSKALSFQESISVPLLIYDKDLNNKNTISDYICSTIDIIPTFITLCGLIDNNSPSQFIGTSVVEKNNNNFISKDNTNETNSIFFTANSDSFTAYFSYAFWFLSQENGVRERVYKPPKNIFQFQYANLVITKLYNNKLYKFGVCTSLEDLLYANTTKENLISKSEIFKVLNIYILQGKVYYVSIIKKLNKVLPDGDFPITDGLEIIYDKIGFIDTVSLYSYLAIVFLKLTNNNLLKYTLPSYGKSYYDLKLENKLTLFCYNLTNDKSEIYNLLDPKNYNEINDPIFESLQNSLNENVKKLYLEKVIYLVPSETFLDIINSLFESIGDNINNINNRFILKINNIVTYSGYEDYEIIPNPLINPYTNTENINFDTDEK